MIGTMKTGGKSEVPTANPPEQGLKRGNRSLYEVFGYVPTANPPEQGLKPHPANERKTSKMSPNS
tara:strand:- start:113 stop:307 length:195 start_codon:yes stop_codon:yes gene_type:complete